METKANLFKIICKNLYKEQKKTLKTGKRGQTNDSLKPVTMAKKEILKQTQGDHDKIMVVKAQAQNGTAMDFINFLIAMLALVVNSFSMMIAVVNSPSITVYINSANSDERVLTGGTYNSFIVIILLIYVIILFSSVHIMNKKKYMTYWQPYVLKALEQLLDNEQGKTMTQIVDLLAQLNEGVNQLIEQQKQTSELMRIVKSEEEQKANKSNFFIGFSKRHFKK